MKEKVTIDCLEFYCFFFSFSQDLFHQSDFFRHVMMENYMICDLQGAYL